jgi:hypothetical protein
VRLGLLRVGVRAPVLVALLSLAVGVMVGLVERDYLALGAADRSLSVVFSLLIPLSSFAVTSLVVGRARLDDAVWPWARHGLPRRQLIIGMLLVGMLVAALIAAVTALAALLLSHGATAAFGRDALTTCWIGALAAAAYVAWFGLGAAFWRMGRGRWLVLIADFTIGGGVGVMALPWPRAHLRSLIGFEAVADLPQRTSSVLLAAMAAVLLLLAALRFGD